MDTIITNFFSVYHRTKVMFSVPWPNLLFHWLNRKPLPKINSNINVINSSLSGSSMNIAIADQHNELHRPLCKVRDEILSSSRLAAFLFRISLWIFSCIYRFRSFARWSFGFSHHLQSLVSISSHSFHRSRSGNSFRRYHVPFDPICKSIDAITERRSIVARFS